jgi:hypothetical protein
MVARLELYNGLAPIQEYARHQTQAIRKRQKKQEGEEEIPEANYND